MSLYKSIVLCICDYTPKPRALIVDGIKSKLPAPTMGQQFEVVRYGTDRINYKETSDINHQRPKKG